MAKPAGLIRTVALVVALTACTGPIQPSPAGTRPDPTQSPTGNQQVTVDALGGDLTLDPTTSRRISEGAVIRQVFEPLLRFDRDLNPVPAAARSFDASPDGKVYIFHIDPNGRYSDGLPVRAADFEYSFKRLLDPKLSAPYADFLVAAGIVGASDYHLGRTREADAVGVKALDDLTLEIDLQAPIGYLPQLAALREVSPLRKDVIDANPDGWATDPTSYIGNGPFKMTELVPQNHISLEPNPYYAGQKPTLQRVTFVPAAVADYARFRDGQLDWTVLPSAFADELLADPRLSADARQYDQLQTTWLAMNNARYPFNSPLVRQAFSRAIDREAIIQDIYGGMGKPALSFIPPGMPGYQPELGTDLGFDPALAGSLLDKAGFADRTQFPQLTLDSGSWLEPSLPEAIQAQLKQNLGISIQVRRRTSSQLAADATARNFDLVISNWNADYPDPQDWLNLFTCHASFNVWSYCDEAFDVATAQGDSDRDQTQRLTAYARAQQILVQDLPVVPLLHGQIWVLVKPYVQDLVITPQDDFPGVFFLNLVSLRH
jgi:oligopeptide transport system substrate-binding protein